MEAREKNFTIPKEAQEENQFILSNLEDINLIIIFTTFSAVVITLIAMILIPERIDRSLIIYVTIIASIAQAIFLSSEKLYSNHKFSYVPDIIFVTAITLNMHAFREFGDFYFILFIILIAIDAFALRMKYFVLIVIYMALTVILLNVFFAKEYYPQSLIPVRTFMQFYSIVITAIVMKFFATKALSERQEKEKIRRLAENTLSAIKNLRTLIDNIGDGIFAVDNDQRIYTSNTAAINIVGWKKAIINRTINDVMPIKTSDLRSFDPVAKVLSTGKPYKSSELVLKKDKEQVKLYVNIAPIFGPMNKPQGAIVIFRDITKEKEMEEQRMEFVAVSSHELRTPLTILEGYLYNLLHNENLKYDEQSRTFIEKAHKSAKDLQNLITDLLDVSKIEQDKLKLDKSLFDVVEIAKEVDADLSKKARDAGLSLSLEVKQKSIGKIEMDRARIKEVFINLITNAIKYSEKGRISVFIKKEDSNAVISVSDTGIGMSAEDQKYIFNKFYRAENWRAKKTSGTGLGLYITKTIIENHKGRVWVESKIGKGSTFFFSLPIAKKRVKSKKLTVSKKYSGPKELGEMIKNL